MRLLLPLLLLSVFAYGQDFEKNYLGKEFRDYLGAKFKLESSTSSFKLERAFYNDIEEAKKFMGQSSLFAGANKDEELEKLKNIVFTVKGFYNKSGEKLDNNAFELRPIFELEGNDLNTYFFTYDARKEMYFPFLVSLNSGGIDYCSKIKKETDDFNGETTWSSPTNSSDVYGPQIMLFEKDGKKDIYLSLSAFGSTLNVKEKGAIILFDDGTKIEKPNAEVDTDVTDGSNWRYSVFLTLTKSELEILSTKKMTKFRLFIYDSDVKGSEQIMQYSKCINEVFSE